MTFQNLSTTQKILLGGFIISFGSIWIGFISQLYFSDSSYNFLGKKDRERLTLNKPISQIFLAKENGLSQVKVCIGGIDLWPGEAIQFELRDESCAHILATDSWTPFESKPLIYTRFDFNRISDSQDKKYCAYITYTSPYNRKSGDAPYINTNQFPGKSYTLVTKNKIYENETLQLRPAYTSGNIIKDVWHLTERISQYKPEFIKGLPLLILMSLVLSGSFLLGLWIIFTKEDA